MVRGKKEPVKTIAFKTKSGKEVSFVPKGKAVAKKKVQMKSLEKRLSAMEKAILNYNHAVQAREERKKSEGGEQGVRKGGKQGDKPAKGKKANEVVVVDGKARA